MTKSIPAQSPTVPRDPKHPLLPKSLQTKTMSRSSLYPYLSISWSHEHISILSGLCICRFQSCHPLSAALSFKIWGALVSASMEQFGKQCAMLHWITASRRMETREACVPAWDLPPVVGPHPLGGLSPWVALLLLVLQVLLFKWGAEPEAQNI